MNTGARVLQKSHSAGGAIFGNDIGANAQILMSNYGFGEESDVESVLESFTLNGVTTSIGPGKYKSGILILDLAAEANYGGDNEREFVLTPEMKAKARAYLTPTLCSTVEDAPEAHPTAAVLLQDGDVFVSVKLASGTLKIRGQSAAQSIIETAFEHRADITPRNVDAKLKDAVYTVIEQLDQGKLRVAEKIDGQWVTHQWLKKAVLLSFRIEDNFFIKGGFTNYYDKVPSKFSDYNSKEFREGGFRVVPPAAARKGSFIAKNVVLMPSYVNIGAYVGEGTMVDTWATVGSCAQIGKNVHLSGGVGIGGVLEPVQANPTIIEDNCFIGARSEIVEGVIVGEGCVISMGVYIGQSTKIYDRETGETHYGRIPAGSVVVSGNLPSKDGSYSLYCAVIVKKVDAKTLAKVGINELLRGI